MVGSGVENGKLVREQAERACRTEMESVPADVPYTVVDLAGKGSFGSVFKGIHNETKKVFAIKSLDLDQQDDEIKDIQKEIALLSQLKAGDAPNITAFYGSYVLGHKLWIIIDFCSGGSMRTLMKAGPIEEKYIGVVVRETLLALAYLHNHGIIHRDIKAANILVNQDGRVQLCDFGVSAQLVSGKNNKRNTFVGTPQWMAPEALAGGLYDSKIDIWSFGITIYEMAKQNPPLYQYHPEKVVDMIPRMPPPRLEGGNWSNSLREFVALCLNEVADHRPNAEELQKSKFVKACRAPTTMMRELITRYEHWEKGGGVRSSMLYNPNHGSGGDSGSDISDPAWDFDTIKSRISGVPKEFDAMTVGAKNTLRGRPSSNNSPRPRGGAERLFRLFEDPESANSAPWEENMEPMPPMPEIRDHQPWSNGRTVTQEKSSGSFGMISIPSFDDDGMMLPSDMGNNHSASASINSPNTNYGPNSVPSFNNSIFTSTNFGNSYTANRAPSPIGMISMPTEDEMMEMAMSRAAASAAATPPPPPLSSVTPPPPPTTSPGPPPIPPLPTSVPAMPPMPVQPTITRTRPHRADSAAASLLQPVEIDGQTLPRDYTPSSHRTPVDPASAPSSPPRPTVSTSPNTLVPNPKSHHSSKSVPSFPGRRDEPAPPIPSGLNLPGPHLKSRSQDITTRVPDIPLRQQRPNGKPPAPRPSHLNLGPTNFDADRLRQHKYSLSAYSAPVPEIGSLEFPLMAPLDTTVVSLPSGNGELMRELDRVLTGLGDALEAVEVGLRRLRDERRSKVPVDIEE